jgi:hypothetical protein
MRILLEILLKIISMIKRPSASESAPAQAAPPSPVKPGTPIPTPSAPVAQPAPAKPKTPIEQVAEDLGADPRLIEAFIMVESGKWHKYKGKLLINYEEHYFKNRTGIVVPDRDFVKGAQDPLGQIDEWASFEEAKKINEEAAYQSISLGRTQIMGANFKILGYPSAKAMFEAFDASEDAAIFGFGKFVKANKNLLKAVQTKDYPVMAACYNGPAYKKYVDSRGMTYDQRIKEKYDEICSRSTT